MEGKIKDQTSAFCTARQRFLASSLLCTPCLKVERKLGPQTNIQLRVWDAEVEKTAVLHAEILLRWCMKLEEEMIRVSARHKINLFHILYQFSERLLTSALRSRLAATSAERMSTFCVCILRDGGRIAQHQCLCRFRSEDHC